MTDSAISNGFIILSLLVAGVITWALRPSKVGIGIVAWMALTGALAASGMLSDFSQLPPRLPLLLVTGFAAAAWLGISRHSQPLLRLPLSWLIGFQAFRIAVEILIHAAVAAKIAPPQMTWGHMNYDIITGVSALLIAPFASRLHRNVLLAWNCIGLGLLIWVVGVAVVSFPTPFQLLKPDNTWVAHFPYIWLPAVSVTAALLGHIVVFRSLRPTLGFERDSKSTKPLHAK